MTEQKKMVVVIPSYKNSKWYGKNLDSVLSQNYTNYRVIYTDDNSPDKTGELVEKYLEPHPNRDKVQLVQNTERLGALRNLYDMIHSCQDDEVVLTLDGDDWFANNNVLARVNQEYQDPNVWMTWGQYKDHPGGGTGCSRAIPLNVTQQNMYRRFRWCSSHLRTFYAWLFKKIKKEDLMFNGKFAPMAWDLFMMFPMLEMSGGRGKFIPDTLYIYNHENPIQDYKTNIKLQQSLEMYIRRQPSYATIK